MLKPAVAHAQLDELFAGRYRLGMMLGAGGQASVWRAYDNRLGIEVAIKIANPGIEGSCERLHREASIASRLTNPHVVRIYDYGESSGTHYVAMELIRGTNLRKVLQRESKIDPAWCAAISQQVCRALSVIHREGFLHRDIKPENVFVSDGGHVRLVDFGLARSLVESSELTCADVVAGTPGYVPPESGDLCTEDERRDIFGLGIIMLEMLTGVRPSPEISVSEALKGECPPALVGIIQNCLAPIESRYNSAERVLAELSKYLAGEGVQPRTRPIWALWTGLAVALAFSLSVAFGLSKLHSTSKKAPPDPVRATRSCEQGARDLNLRLFDAARQQFNVGLELDSNQARCLFGLTELGVTQFVNTGDPRYLKEAEETASRLAALDKESSATHMAKAMVLLEQRNRKDALPHIQVALAQSPDLPDPHIVMAGYDYYTGRFSDGLGEVDHALKLDPQSAKGHQLRALLLRSLKRYPEAEHEYKEVLRINPGHEKAMLNLGSLLLSLGRFEEAVVVFDRSILHRESIEGFMGQVQGYLFSGSCSLAALASERALKVYSGSEVLHGLYGEALYCDGRVVEAAEQFAVAIGLRDKDPKSPLYYSAEMRLVRYFARRGQLSEAKNLISKAKQDGQIDPTRIAYAEAIVAASEGNFKLAAEHWKAGVEAGYPKAYALADPVWSVARHSPHFRAIMK